MSLRSFSQLVAIALVFCAGRSAFAFDDSDITDYGQECKAELGALPWAWNCLKGEILKIDRKDHVDRAPCATPPWLTLGNNPDHCVRGARLLQLDTTNNSTDVRVICRRYTNRVKFETDPTFEDIAVVAHNNDTGKTCFFQALNYQGMDGSAVPSPMADPKSVNPVEAVIGQFAKSFWKAPASLNEGSLRCTVCHDNDAWMHTPYIDQIRDEKKGVPLKSVDSWEDSAIDEPNKYSLVQQDYFVKRVSPDEAWPQPIAVLTAKVRDGYGKDKPQACTGCHRIADQETKTTWLDWATAFPTHIVSQATNLDWKHYRYMPILGDIKDNGDWKKRFETPLKAMMCCLEHPTYNGCAQMPVLGIKKGDTPTWGNAKNGTCIDNTGDVAFSAMLDKAVVAARGENEDSCDSGLDKPARASFTIAHKIIGGAVVNPSAGADKSFGVQVPKGNSTLVATAQLFPGDQLELQLLETTAWDKDHRLLKFDRWTDTAGGQGQSKACPCEDPANPICKFTTLGASDWFGENPDQPTFPGDPEKFECVAQFVAVGECKKPGHGSKPIRNLPGLERVVIYEQTVERVANEYEPSAKALMTRLPDPLDKGNNDFSFYEGEYYDVFYSDSKGKPDNDGAYITIEGVWRQKELSSGSMNINEVELRFENDRKDFGDRVTDTAFGSWCAPEQCIRGSEKMAVDGNLDTFPRFGQTSFTDRSERFRLTIAFD